jgi:hypothetical protein
MMIALKAKLRSRNTARSRIGSAVDSSRARKAVSTTTATIASVTMYPESNQSCCSPWSNMSWRAPKPTTMNTRPAASTRRGFLRKGESKRKTLAMKKPSRPIGRLT